MDRPHDYEITWDYELDENISNEHKNILNKVLEEINSNIIPKLNTFKIIEVYPIILDNTDLGTFCYGTCEQPVIGIDINNIVKGCDKYNVNIITGIRTTITHELAHAVQEYKGKIFDEDEAEDFARDYEDFGTANKI